MRLSLDWPALSPSPSTATVAFERAVWGKVHGARSDFRWIAASSGFDRASSLERQLTVGVEDRPHRATFWRALDKVYLGVGIYPSRSTDAAGRGGHLIEKQILSWRPPDDLPAAFGALVLLPYVAGLGDDIWWPRRTSSRWVEDDFALSIDASQHPVLTVDEEQLWKAVSRGIQALRTAVTETALVDLYAQILSGQRPSWLRGLERPLTPEALAALLLPLPRSLADQISIAGWIPSSRADIDQLSERWQILIEPVGRKLAPDIVDVGESAKDSWALAEALLNSDPTLATPVAENFELAVAPATPEPIETPLVETPRIETLRIETPAVETLRIETPWVDEEPVAVMPSTPEIEGSDSTTVEEMVNDLNFDDPIYPGTCLPLSAPPPDSPTVLQELYDFARSADRRWLRPHDLADIGRCQPLEVDGPAASTLIEWVHQVEDHRPAYAHPEQWAVKVDLLRAAAITLVPRSSTLKAVGRLTSGQVPPLIFGGLLEPRSMNAILAYKEPLRKLVNESLGCPDERLRTEVIGWLGAWRENAVDEDVRTYLTKKLAQRGGR